MSKGKFAVSDAKWRKTEKPATIRFEEAKVNLILPLLICGKLGTIKINCGEKIWKKPCLFTFISRK